MYRFWQTVLLEEHTYFGSPFPPHMHMPVDKFHFDTWVGLFHQTVDELYEGEKADRAKWQGSRMAEMFQHKIAYYREQKEDPLPKPAIFSLPSVEEQNNMKLQIQIKRIYEPYDSADGYRILIDRLWPRGIAKAEAHLDEWNKK